MRKRDVVGNFFRSRVCSFNRSEKTCAKQEAACTWDPTRKKCRKRKPSDTIEQMEMTSMYSRPRAPAPRDVEASEASLDSELSEESTSSTPRSSSVDSEQPVHELHEETRSFPPSSRGSGNPSSSSENGNSSSWAERETFLSPHGLRWQGLPQRHSNSENRQKNPRIGGPTPAPAEIRRQVEAPRIGGPPHAPAAIRHQVEAYDLDNDAAAPLTSVFDLDLGESFVDYCRRGNCKRGQTLRECRNSSDEPWRDFSKDELRELDSMISDHPDYVCDPNLLETACSQGGCNKGQTLGSCRKQSRLWKGLSMNQLNRVNPSILLHPEYICTQEHSKPRLRAPVSAAKQLGAVGALLGVSTSILPQTKKASQLQEISRKERIQKDLEFFQAARKALASQGADPRRIPFMQDVYSMGAFNRMKM